MLLLSKEDIRKVFTIQDAIAADKLAFRMVAENTCEIPLRTNIQAPKYEGCFLAMPAYAESIDAASIKVINIFPHNIDHGLPSAPAQVFLMDGTTGMVDAILDGTYVTQLRTGAASGAAFDVLARTDCRIGALIGTGGQAATQLEAMLAVRQLEEVRVYDRDQARTEAFAGRMREELAAYGTQIVAVSSSDAAIENADLIITVTPSRTPVFDGNKVKAGATVSCVGSYQPFMQELDPALLPRTAKIFFDAREAVLAEAGDILIPLAEGIITEADFSGDLGDVLLGRVPGRESEEEIIVFETVGVAAQDLCAAKAIYEKALAAGVGTTWISG